MDYEIHANKRLEELVRDAHQANETPFSTEEILRERVRAYSQHFPNSESWLRTTHCVAEGIIYRAGSFQLVRDWFKETKGRTYELELFTGKTLPQGGLLIEGTRLDKHTYDKSPRFGYGAAQELGWTNRELTKQEIMISPIWKFLCPDEDLLEGYADITMKEALSYGGVKREMEIKLEDTPERIRRPILKPLWIARFDIGTAIYAYRGMNQNYGADFLLTKTAA